MYVIKDKISNFFTKFSIKKKYLLTKCTRKTFFVCFGLDLVFGEIFHYDNLTFIELATNFESLYTHGDLIPRQTNL